MTLTNEELRAPHKGINSKTFRERLTGLKHDVAPGIGGLRNEHLLLLLLNPDRQMTLSVAAAVDHMYDYANAVVKVALPPYFYIVFVVCRLVPANKIHPANLPPVHHRTADLSTSADLRGVSSHGHSSITGSKTPTTKLWPQSRMVLASVGASPSQLLVFRQCWMPTLASVSSKKTL